MQNANAQRSEFAHSGQWLGALLACALVAGLWWFKPNWALGPALALLPLLGVAVCRWPFLVVLGFVLLSFFRLHEAFPWLYPLRLPQALALASLFTLFWQWQLSRRLQPYWRPELTILTLFMVLVALGALLASNRGLALGYLNGVFIKIWLMTLAIAWLMQRQQDFARANWAFVLAGLAVAAVALHNAKLGLELVEGSRVTIGRSFGSTLGDPNDLALVLLFPLAFALALWRQPDARWLVRVVALLSALALVSALLATQSRGGLMGVVAVVLVTAWQRTRRKGLLVAAMLLLAPALFLLAGITDRVSGGAAEAGIDESAMGRLYAWQAAWRMAWANPLTGVGLDNFYANYYFFSDHWDGRNHAVHSTWFGVLAEAGWLGFSVFLALVIRLLRQAKRNVALAHGQAPVWFASAGASQAALVGVLVSGTFLTHGFTWPLYILTALIVAQAQALQPLDSQNANDR
ncbi:O-antigen ligase family protein [Ferrimonas marina]|uniref:Probable O-glycosylation ligase, exosortase A-associated n=1 Tax=Ferrimonas marina TaxID=299255 RepID=A0A1M5RS28_9GAMM|nr:O-antigen ligase family protein [Ferrimonas marina]SHH29084.1 probable O-glycosylation ligase, exosortase A-associated [Ferrimonas marina]